MYSGSLTTRPLITDEQLKEGLQELEARIRSITDRTGCAAHASPHEIVGDLDEEFLEFRQAVHDGNVCDQASELLDIATAALWGYIGISRAKVRQ